MTIYEANVEIGGSAQPAAIRGELIKVHLPDAEWVQLTALYRTEAGRLITRKGISVGKGTTAGELKQMLLHLFCDETDEIDSSTSVHRLDVEYLPICKPFESVGENDLIKVLQLAVFIDDKTPISSCYYELYDGCELTLVHLTPETAQLMAAKREKNMTFLDPCCYWFGATLVTLICPCIIFTYVTELGHRCAHCPKYGAISPRTFKEVSRERDTGAELPATFRHLNVHEHLLTKLPSVYKGQYTCDLCRDLGSGYVYHCDACGFDCHPQCCLDSKSNDQDADYEPCVLAPAYACDVDVTVYNPDATVYSPDDMFGSCPDDEK